MPRPTFPVGAVTTPNRLAIVIDDGPVVRVFYPVFPPDRSAAEGFRRSADGGT